MRKGILLTLMVLHSLWQIKAQDVQVDSSNVIKITYTYQNPDHRNTSDYINHDTYLYITEKESWYSNVFEGKTYEVNGNMTYTAHLAPQNFLFKLDYAEEEFTAQRIIEGGTVLRTEFSVNKDWNITNETKMIKGHEVRKAIRKTDENPEGAQFDSGDAIAWFTTDFPVPAGPRTYAGLPGVVLQVEFADTRKRIILKEIDMGVSDGINEKLKFEEGDQVSFENFMWMEDKSLIRSIKRKQRKQRK